MNLISAFEINIKSIKSNSFAEVMNHVLIEKSIINWEIKIILNKILTTENTFEKCWVAEYLFYNIRY